MSMIPQLMSGRRLEHDAVSDKGWHSRSPGNYVQIFDDFFGDGALALDGATLGTGGLFVNHDTSSSGAPTFAFQGAADGVYRMKFSSTDESQKIATYLGDAVCIPPTKKPIFEARVKITGTFSADDRVVIGLGSARNATLDSVADHVWFRMEGANNNILVEGDDAATDNDDNDTSVDWTTGTFHIYKIDMSDTSNVRFFVDGTECVLPEAIDVSGMVAGDLLQPIIELQKDAGTVQHSVDVDYISVLWERS